MANGRCGWLPGVAYSSKTPVPTSVCSLGIYVFAHLSIFILYRNFKVPLKAKIRQILFSQMHQNYVKYTFETFTFDGIAIAYQIESIAGIRMF
jgi:hypothetical protein